MSTKPRTSLLPTARSSPVTGVESVSTLLYGPSKAGKTTFASQADDALFLATEPGLNALSVYQVPITTWDQFLAVCGEIEAGDHPFRTIVIDTVDCMYRLIVDHVRAQLGIAHEADVGFGKAYSLIHGELHRVLSKLAFLPYGLIVISHSEDREVPTRTGKIVRSVPSLPEKARRIVLDLVDVIAFVELIEDTEDGMPVVRRVIRTRPHPRYEAGDRTGRLPATLPLDYPAFKSAFETAGNGKEV